jgi:hypothetical protein
MRELSCIAQACIACVSMSLFLTDPYEMAHVRAFYSSRSDSYNESCGSTDGIKAGQILYYRAQRLGVENDVLYDVSSVESSCLIALLH